MAPKVVFLFWVGSRQKKHDQPRAMTSAGPTSRGTKLGMSSMDPRPQLREMYEDASQESLGIPLEAFHARPRSRLCASKSHDLLD